MDNNYIGKVDAEWVDPKVELPMGVPTGPTNPPAWEGLADFGDAPIFPGIQMAHYHDDHGWGVGIDGVRPPLRWLRIGGPSTAIPREKVQALSDLAKKRIGHGEIVQASEIYGLLVQEIEHFTGIKPRSWNND